MDSAETATLQPNRALEHAERRFKTLGMRGRELAKKSASSSPKPMLVEGHDLVVVTMVAILRVRAISGLLGNRREGVFARLHC